MEHTEQPPVALSRQLLEGPPVLISNVPWLFNWWCRRRIDRVLRQRDPVEVKRAWLACPHIGPETQRVIEATATIYDWPAALLLPDDECFVLMRFWHRTVADAMELESWLLWMEENIAPVPDELIERLDQLTLGQLVSHLGALAGRA